MNMKFIADHMNLNVSKEKNKSHILNESITKRLFQFHVFAPHARILVRN